MITTGAYRGRRISYEAWRRRQAVSPTVLSPHNVLDVLFVTALNYPEDDEVGIALPHMDTMPARDRRALYWTWLESLPLALKAAGMQGDLPDVLAAVWGTCTATQCPLLPGSLPPALRAELRALRAQFATGAPSRGAMFELVCATRALFMQDSSCMASAAVMASTSARLAARYEQARASDARQPPEGSCEDGACYVTRQQRRRT
jgi:hypothetical protein